MKKINEVFNPSKITIAGKSKIIDTKEGSYILKPKNKDIKNLYTYLNSRNFDSYPKLVDEIDDSYVYERLKEVKSPVEQKCTDMAKLLGALHTKTAYFKDISVDKVKEIYENLLNNIDYLENTLESYYNEYEPKNVLTPSANLLLANRTRLTSLIKFVKDEIESWYNLTSLKDKERVVYCHNNLSIDHYIDNKFISWDNYTVDTPILDLINLYHNDFGKYNYGTFFETYLKNFSLLEEEKKLFFITISIPKFTPFTKDEMSNSVNISKMLDYIDETEKLMRPYYSVEKKE